MATVLIKNGSLLDPCRAFGREDIYIEGDRIVQIEASIDRSADTVIDATDKIVLPGLVNAHAHATTLLFRGLTDNLPFEPWLLFHMHAGMGRLSPRDLYVASAIGAIEMLKTGTTSVIEHGHVSGSLDGLGERVHAIARGLLDAGIRAAVAPMYSDVNLSERIPLHLLDNVPPELIDTLNPFTQMKPGEVLQVLRQLGRQFHNKNPRLSFFLGPSNPNACSRALLEGTLELSAELDLGIQTHLLESRCMRISFPSVVDNLAETNFLGPRVSFAHGVWIDQRDILTLARTNTSVIHNPISNMRLGSGIAPVQAMRASGINVALGTDNAGNANDSQNMFEVIKSAALVHKLYGPSSEWINAQDAWRMGLENGARVLRKSVGALSEGYLADIAIVGSGRFFVTSKDSLINQLIYADLGTSIETVLVGGEVVIHDKRVVTLDEEGLYAEAKESAFRLFAGVESLKERLAPGLNLLSRMCEIARGQQLPLKSIVREQ
jgi:5-methylthioadenosine/S-adenosylhomocysteine deaminase